MWSVPSRRRLASHARTMWYRDSPPSFGPGPMSPRTFVATSTSSRFLPSASPRICSDRPFEYTSAVSKRLTPASRQRSICRRAPSTSIRPTGLAQPVPPKPIVPRVTVETRSPDRPSCLYSMPRPYGRAIPPADADGAPAPQSSAEQVVTHDRVAALRADADRGDPRAGEVLEREHVGLRRLREVLERARAGDVVVPAVEVLVHGPGVVEVRLRHRHLVVPDAVHVVAHADRDPLEP